MSTPKSELYVITASKRLVSYILEISDKSPKKYRHTIIDRVINHSLSVIESLYAANEIKLGDNNRLLKQNEAKLNLKNIDYLCSTGVNIQCFTFHQYEHVSTLLADCYNSLSKWIESDDKRRNK